MKILVTGASGLLGHAYAEAAVRRGHQVTGLYHKNPPAAEGLAATRALHGAATDELTSLCLDLWPDVIVNAAALSSPAAVDAAPEEAEKINVALPRRLAQIANHLGARFLQISTDMVFDGQAEEPYRSTDMPAPGLLYGQTKLLAEREVLEHHPEDPVVLRIPILMGNSPGGRRSVHEKLFRALAANESPRLFDDEIRQPCSAENVAEVLLELSERRDLHGIFHWAGSETLSRLEMGRRILEHFGLPADRVLRASQSEDDGARPGRLTFNLHPLVNKLKTRPPSFQEQLDELRLPEDLESSFPGARTQRSST